MTILDCLCMVREIDWSSHPLVLADRPQKTFSRSIFLTYFGNINRIFKRLRGKKCSLLFFWFHLFYVWCFCNSSVVKSIPFFSWQKPKYSEKNGQKIVVLTMVMESMELKDNTFLSLLTLKRYQWNQVFYILCFGAKMPQTFWSVIRHSCQNHMLSEGRRENVKRIFYESLSLQNKVFWNNFSIHTYVNLQNYVKKKCSDSWL